MAIAQAPSMAPVAENDQQEPHCPWSLTGVTAFFVRQSTESGTFEFWNEYGEQGEEAVVFDNPAPTIFFLNSVADKSVKRLMAIVKLCFSKLCCIIVCKFSLNMSKR